jgi:hypothetical protein
VKQALADPAGLGAMGAAAREAWHARFSVAAMTDGYERIFTALHGGAADKEGT